MRSVEEKVKIAVSAQLCSSEATTPETTGRSESAGSEATSAAPRNHRSARPRLGAPRKITGDEAAKEAAEAAAAAAAAAEEAEAIEKQGGEEDTNDLESHEARFNSIQVNTADQIILPHDCELELGEKVVAGALMSILNTDCSEIEGVRTVADALTAIQDALLEAQGEVVGACPRCATLLAVNLKHLVSVMEIYAAKEAVHEHSIYTGFWDPGAPLGSHRLKSVEVVVQLVQPHSEFVDERIIQSRILERCVRLFFEYPKSSALHCAVSNLCEAILRGPSQDMIFDLLVTSGLCERLGEAAKAVLDLPPASRPVNTGFVIDLSLAIHDVEVACPSVADWLATETSWTAYTEVDGVLSQYLQEQQGPTIGGPLPTMNDEDDWMNDDPARREQEVMLILNSFGVGGPPPDIREALERQMEEAREEQRAQSLDQQMIDLHTMELQAELEERAQLEIQARQEMEMQIQRMQMDLHTQIMPQMDFHTQMQMEMEQSMHSYNYEMEMRQMEMQQMEMQQMEIEASQGLSMSRVGAQEMPISLSQMGAGPSNGDVIYGHHTAPTIRMHHMQQQATRADMQVQDEDEITYM